MEHASIASAYDTLAERWTDAAFDPGNGLRLHAQALSFLEDGEGWALGVGCGCNTRFNPLLRARGLRLEGVDISERMLALARAADPDVLLHHGDVCAWQLSHTYRFISAWDSIWHVRLAQQRPLMLKLMRALEPGGVFIFSAGGLDAPGEHVDAAMGPEVYYATLGIPGLLDVVAEAGCMVRHLEFDQHPDQHLCVIVQRAG
ncbi:class I SAM-dependent methyltransferase [Massilia sp. ST3]|uniref:class I SAM-dependent DNA methyltransferase n=1 Tax=Massilia sp. ST3 TaxID=2824903 RepID=UPI001B81FB27|nr:class I SAM-dependent methyltransferase [Massilia sp. ST3]MBQ5949162.1 class I SAM-dependent methyltransferase [Massilia sp. ST3]